MRILAKTHVLKCLKKWHRKGKGKWSLTRKLFVWRFVWKRLGWISLFISEFQTRFVRKIGKTKIRKIPKKNPKPADNFPCCGLWILTSYYWRLPEDCAGRLGVARPRRFRRWHFLSSEKWFVSRCNLMATLLSSLPMRAEKWAGYCSSKSSSDAQREAYKKTTNAEHVNKCFKQMPQKKASKNASKKEAAMTF
jgi:hypothetical protein